MGAGSDVRRPEYDDKPGCEDSGDRDDNGEEVDKDDQPDDDKVCGGEMRKMTSLTSHGIQVLGEAGSE